MHDGAMSRRGWGSGFRYVCCVLTVCFCLEMSALSSARADSVAVVPIPSFQLTKSGATVTLGCEVTGGSGTKTYAWVQASGPSVDLVDADQATATFTAVDVSARTRLTFKLTVSDSSESTPGEATATVDILAPAPAPLEADAGADQAAVSGTTVTLSGLARGGVVAKKTFSWAQTSGSPTVSIASTGLGETATFAAPTVTTETTLGFTLTVTVGSETATDTVEVAVFPALSAEAGSAQTVDSKASVTLSGSATGGIGVKSYAWAQTGGSPTVTIGSADQASASFTAPLATMETTLEFTLTATAGSETATDTVSVTVLRAPPQVAGLSLVSRPRSGDTYKQGETIRAQVWLSELSAVSGSPQLSLGVGSQTRTMSYVGLERTQVLEFEYAVQASDADTDGVSVGSSALSLPAGASLVGEADRAVAVSLSGHAVANASGHKVDGSQSAASPLPDLNACPGD